VFSIFAGSLGNRTKTRSIPCFPRQNLAQDGRRHNNQTTFHILSTKQHNLDLVRGKDNGGHRYYYYFIVVNVVLLSSIPLSTSLTTLVTITITTITTHHFF
jgi:hypothetical protein